MRNTTAKSATSPMKSPLMALGASILFVLALLGIMVALGVHVQLLRLLEWVEDQGAWAAVLFILIMAAVVVLLLPGILFTLGAGFVFGVVEGTIYVVVGTTLGAALAFLIARYLFGRRAAAFIVRHSRMSRVTDEMCRHDFKVVLLTRLIPFFPGKLSNYFFGLTPFSFRHYTAASFLGFIPFSLHNVYLGSLAADLSTLSQGGFSRSPFQWALYGLGFVATVIAVWYFNRLAQRALADLAPAAVETGEGESA